MIDKPGSLFYNGKMPASKMLGLRLPITHYDVLKEREPWLFEIIENNIIDIHQKGVTGPLGLNDDYETGYVEEYTNRKLEVIKSSLQQFALSKGLAPLSEKDLAEVISRHPDFANLMPAMIADYMSCLNFELFEKKTLYLTGRLIDQLAHTELNAPSEFLKLPFPSCMFVLEGSTALNAMYAIAKTDAPEGNVPISVFVSERSHEDGLRKLLISCFHSGKERNHFHVKRELLIHPEWNIENSLKTDWAKLYEEHPDWEDAKHDSFPHALADESPFYSEGLQFFRIIVNAILYISSNDPDIVDCFSPKQAIRDRLSRTKAKAKQKKARNELNKTSELNYSVLGSRLPPIFVDKRTIGPNDGGSSRSLEYAARFIVRRHWRNQACGEGRKEHRLIWIKPYYKGPDMGEMINRPYVIK
jgi:hypothetical protein